MKSEAMEQEVKRHGEATGWQIEQWKGKWGEVYMVEVDLDEEGREVAVGYFRSPDLGVLSLVSRLSEDQVRAAEALLENLWLGGDERFKTDDKVKLAAFQQLPKLVEVRASRLKKL